MSSFSALKKQSGSTLDKLSKAVEALNEKSDKPDNFWRPEVDKAGNGMATIRFLPASEADGEDSLPWVKMYSHGFQGPGGWLIDNCLTTKGEACPICEHNSVLWNSGLQENKDKVSKQKRKLNYISNVYIVSDPKHPENEGKVFLFRYGKKIFDKLTEAMNPAFEDETAINPFDLWKGANFKLKIRKVDGFANYDKSEFESPEPLASDDELEKIWKSEYCLSDLVADKEFKSYDTLKGRLEKVLGHAGEPRSSTAKKSVAEEAKSSRPAFKRDEEPASESTDSGSDEDYFSRLAAMDD
jgi:gp32 DNA binding protein like